MKYIVSFNVRKSGFFGSLASFFEGNLECEFNIERMDQTDIEYVVKRAISEKLLQVRPKEPE